MYEYKATVDRVVDGDTIDFYIDLGFKIITHQRIRINNIDAPETRGINAEKEKGAAATQFVEDMLANHAGDITLLTHKTGKYGRWLADIYLGDKNLGDEILKAGHATRYHG